jgi:hypothetical protein
MARKRGVDVGVAGDGAADCEAGVEEGFVSIIYLGIVYLLRSMGGILALEV